jgi:hypothetical protein
VDDLRLMIARLDEERPAPRVSVGRAFARTSFPDASQDDGREVVRDA